MVCVLLQWPKQHSFNLGKGSWDPPLEVHSLNLFLCRVISQLYRVSPAPVPCHDCSSSKLSRLLIGSPLKIVLLLLWGISWSTYWCFSKQVPVSQSCSMPVTGVLLVMERLHSNTVLESWRSFQDKPVSLESFEGFLLKDFFISLPVDTQVGWISSLPVDMRWWSRLTLAGS